MLGMLDLSIVTDRLIRQLTAFKDESKLWPLNPDGTRTPGTIHISGLAPDAARALGGCQLCIYPFHVAADKFYRNTYPTGGPAQRVPEQPLALTVYYLVAAYSATAYIEEQQAMSIALQFFHQHPRITAIVPPSRAVEMTLTLEPQTVDDLARLWQAFSSSMRMSAVYRVSVVFLEPPGEPVVPRRVEEHGVTLQAVPGPIAATVTAPGGRARIVLDGAGFGDATEVALHDTDALPRDNVALTRSSAAPPPPGHFRVVDARTLELQVPTGAREVGHLALVRPAPDRPTLFVWLVVAPEVTP
jgi:hypothetical protein